MPEEEPRWLKRFLGGNGEGPRSPGPKLGPVERSIVTALVWCMAGLLMLRLRNPELAFVFGVLGAAATFFIWRK